MSALPNRSARDALARVPRGAHIVSAPGMGAPTTLLAEIGRVADGRDWTLSSGLLVGDYPFLPAVAAGALAYRTWHVMAPVRDLVASGSAGYVPIRASRVADVIARWGVGAALVRVSPPDAAGYCSLGGSAGYSLAAVRAARLAIAEVDGRVPRTCGESLVHVSVFDSLVESGTPMPSYSAARPSEFRRRILRRVLDLVPPHPTLQVGIGAVPESLVGALAEGMGDLGTVRFVGMATDDMVDLFEAGILRGADVVPDPAVLSPDMMSAGRLLEFSHENPAIGMYPSTIAHDAGRIGRIERFVSVNTAIEVDLAGNVNSETVDGRQHAGIGGSLDYVDAASRSPGGLRVIALPAASADSAISRIVPELTTVTVPRSMVDVIVTEHGTAVLDGLTIAERAAAMTAIAHPDHRAALEQAVLEKLELT